MTLPIGTILVYSLKSLPPNYLLCNGDEYDGSNSEYADLYNVISNTYGGSGINNFMVPNLVNKFPVGSNALNVSGGSDTINLTPFDMYEHNHTASISMQEHSHEINYTLSGSTSPVTDFSDKYLLNQAFTSTSLDYQTNERTYPTFYDTYYQYDCNLSYNTDVSGGTLIDIVHDNSIDDIEIKNPRIKLNYIIKYKD